MFALAAIPTMLSVAGLLPNGGLTTGIATVIGIAGATILGLAELGSTRHLIDFRRIAPVVTIALIGMPLWIGMISALIVAQGGGWPARLDRAGIVSIVLGIAMIVWIVGTAGVLGRAGGAGAFADDRARGPDGGDRRLACVAGD